MSTLILQPESNFTELLISFSIIMMMLSFVSERLSNFIKLYFQDKKIFIPFIFWIRKKEKNLNKSSDFNSLRKFGLIAELKILSFKQPTVKAEKEREYRIMTINILVGIIIATFANANFFQLVDQISTISAATNENLNILPGWKFPSMKNQGGLILFGMLYYSLLIWSISLMLFNRLVEAERKIKQLKAALPFFIISGLSILMLVISGFNDSLFKSIEDSSFSNVLNHSIGFIITGLFLSLGSKFWHDLLDILFKYKNIRQTLNQKSTYTNYDSPEKLMALANTSHYEVADKLMKKYGDKIKGIDGVVSVGLISKLDAIDGFYKRKIEVEYSSPEAQRDLEVLEQEGSITVNYNTFYLRDYLKKKYTSLLIALDNIPNEDIAEKITSLKPICYAYNIENKKNYGSFNVFKEDGNYYAESNLHVFASQKDFKKFRNSDLNSLIDEAVHFKIGSKVFDGIIKEYKFGNNGTVSCDYSKCEVDKGLYDEYQKIIEPQKMINEIKADDEMKMYGATSKYVDFNPISHGEKTWCKVVYNGFIRELFLYKIERTYSNINKGDSGSIVYYKTKGVNKTYIKKGMIVAKSDSHAYMFLV